ncbi:Probable alpha-galactosidase B [Seminavis robusta]|uniref:Alpha-galactosidase n=1 Tax=Seminavis robusta TaxID=568900 RepID=A0A9N8EHW7_9STRA|nr:Probable alpha-galactosidase B [Seminavis robusta]|eukprot:Sro1027_g233020.1 Probable alpha-galactosidase B (407) ;mRNA; f:8517-9737
MFPTLRAAFLALFLHASTITTTFALDNGLGLTPVMGWNSWNKFACGINETLIHSIADALVSTGLRDLGYHYLNLDDCWQLTRDMGSGKIKEDPNKFPSGMKALGDYIHSKGLKYGLYSDAGLMTCQRRPGSLGLETIDAQSYADFGCDYLKYDNCYAFGLKPQKRYEAMRDALNATGRPIFFSMCEWGALDPATWATPIGNSWRTTGDINPTWGSILEILDRNDPLWPYAGPGAWNDPDMLEVGNGNLTVEQQRSHFTLWAIMKAPLILGNDIRTISQESLDIITNKKIIAINQDKLGAQAHSVWTSDEKDTQVWAGPLDEGEFVIVLFNRGDINNVEIAVHWKDIPDFYTDTTTMVLEDLWCDWNTTATGSFTAKVQAHDVVAFRASPTKKSNNLRKNVNLQSQA